MALEVCLLEPGQDHETCRRADAFVAACDGGHFLQYSAWDRVEGKADPTRRVVVVEDGGAIHLVAALRVARAGGVGPKVAHVERGPVCDSHDALQAALPTLVAGARRAGASSLRIQPYLPRTREAEARVLADHGFSPAKTVHGYQTTLVVDLRPAPDSILRSFRKGTRSAIRQAQGTAVEIVEGGPAEGEVMDRFYSDMVSRKGATPRPAGFFGRLAHFVSERPGSGFFLLSRHEGRFLGGIFVLLHGRRALYAFGASGPPEPGTPKTHILHLEAMSRARNRGCEAYDLCGFSAGTGKDGARTAPQSINLFKSGFTDRVLELMPPQELVLRPALHGLVDMGRRWLR